MLCLAQRVLFQSVPSSSIPAANKMVKKVIEPATTAKKCGSYDSFTLKEKVRVAEKASCYYSLLL